MQIIFHGTDLKPSASGKSIESIKLTDIVNGQESFDKYPNAGIVLSVNKGVNVYRECK